MAKTSQSITCAHCGMPLSKEHTGLCPSCGKEGREISVVVNENIAVTESVRRQTRREYYKKNPKGLIAVILITVISPFLGLFLVGPVGVVAGLVFGVIAYFIGPWAITKVIEIHHG